MAPIVSSARWNKIVQGYAAFNAGHWETIAGLLCEDVVFYPMVHDPKNPPNPITGRDAVIDHLKGLWNGGAEVDLLGVALQGTSAITLDFTYDGPDGDHACADQIEFNKSGCIKEVRHCSTGTHKHGA